MDIFGHFWPFLSYHAESKLLTPEADKPGLHTDTLVKHLKAVAELCVHDHALARFHPIRSIGCAMTGDNLVFLLQTVPQAMRPRHFVDTLLLFAIPALCSCADALSKRIARRGPISLRRCLST